MRALNLVATATPAQNTGATRKAAPTWQLRRARRNGRAQSSEVWIEETSSECVRTSRDAVSSSCTSKTISVAAPSAATGGVERAVGDADDLRHKTGAKRAGGGDVLREA